MSELELPRYRCHKEVQALKIIFVADIDIQHEGEDGGGQLTFEEDAYPSIMVSAEYMRKHTPGAGGYYVLYDDGYESFSPAIAFEEGYTLIE